MPVPKKVSPKTKKWGKNLAKPQTKAGLTQEALAEKADISTRYVQDLEAGLYAPTIWVGDDLRKALQCSWDEFLGI